MSLPTITRIARFYLLARTLGLTFAIKLMESSEENAHSNYDRYVNIRFATSCPGRRSA